MDTFGVIFLVVIAIFSAFINFTIAGRVMISVGMWAAFTIFLFGFVGVIWGAVTLVNLL